MTDLGPAPRRDRTGALRVGGAVLSFAVAAALYARFGIDGTLSRDEGIYLYSGQQMAHGVPPYASLFDPKPPLASILCGLGAMLARLLSLYDIHVIRIVFYGCACLTVVAVYLLAERAFRSTLAGLTAAVVLSCSWPFAKDALSGPDAKTPGVLCAVLAMWFMVRKQWFWAGLLSGLTILTWQPFVIYPAVAVLLALACGGTRRHRLRAAGLTVAGVLLPVLVTVGYFVAAGAFGKLVESAVIFPLEGVQRGPETVPERLRHIADVISYSYGARGLTFWLGVALLILIVVWAGARGRLLPATDVAAHGTGTGTVVGTGSGVLVAVLLVTLLGNAVYAATDFQSVPDLYPFVAYPALGYAAAMAGLVRLVRPRLPRLLLTAAVTTALAVLAGVTWVRFGNDPANDDGLIAQQADACALERLRLPETMVWSLGDPSVLAVAHERNPDRFIYLGSGVAAWKIAHTRGGMSGWVRQIERTAPSVIVLRKWDGPLRDELRNRLSHLGYRTKWIASWRVLVRHRHPHVAVRQPPCRPDRASG